MRSQALTSCFGHGVPFFAKIVSYDVVAIKKSRLCAQVYHDHHKTTSTHHHLALVYQRDNLPTVGFDDYGP